jgi:hypothetical protein
LPACKLRAFRLSITLSVSVVKEFIAVSNLQTLTCLPR